MDKQEFKKLIKKEIAPLLIGIRNDIDDKTKRPLIDKVEGVLLRGKKGDDGYTPIADKDYPSEQTVFQFIKDNLPKKGKDYFTDADIKDIVSSVFNLMPSKEELKGEDGKNGQVDYSVVEKLALPLIENKYKAFKKDLNYVTDRVFKAIEENKIPELSARQIRDKLEGLSGNDRLSAKAIKGLEKFVGVIVGQSAGGGGFIPTLQQVTEKGSTTDRSIEAQSFITTGGTSSDFVKGDGSLDSNTYLTVESDTLADVTGRGATTSTQSTFSGGLLSGLGTALLPSYSFTGDTDTGMWSSGGNNISFSTNGTYRGGFLNGGKFEIDRNGINFLYVTKPTAPTLALAGVAGLVPVGNHYYYVSYVTADGETQLSPVSLLINVASAANAQVIVTIPVSSDPRVTARKIYRSTSSVVGAFLATVADNVTTTYTDNIASVGSNIQYRTPSVGNTTAGNIYSGGTKVIEIDNVGSMRFNNSLASLRMAKSTSTIPQLLLYNTTDEENNVEYGGFKWTSNIFEVGTFARGSGAARKVRLKSSNVSVSMNFDLERGGTDWASLIDSGTSAVGVSFVRYNPTTWTNTSGENRILTLGSVAINQSSSGGYSLFNIDATHTATGSGNKFFSRYTLGGTTIHSVNSDGQQYMLGNIGINTAPNTTYNLDASGVTRSGFRFVSGTRSLTFANFAADLNYLTTSGANLRITTSDATAIEFWTTNTRRMVMGAGGQINMGTPNNLSLTYQVSVQPTVATNLGLVVRGFTAQTANLQEWQNDAGTVLGAFTAAGRLGVGITSPTYLAQIAGTGLATDGLLVSTSVFTSIPNLGTVNGVLLNARGFNMVVDTTALSATYESSFGIGMVSNRAQPLLGLKNGTAATSTNPAIAIEFGRIGVYTPAPAAPIDCRGEIRAHSDQQSAFETRVSMRGNQYLEGGTNVASGGLYVEGVVSGVGYGYIGATYFYTGNDTDANRGWAWKANGNLTEATNLAGSGAQMVLNKAGYLGVNTVAPTSTFHFNGSITGAYRAITALRTLDITDYTVDCTANTFAVTLPTAVGITGRTYIIKNSGTGIITLNTTSSQTIDGTASGVLTLVQYDSITLMSNGANWIKI
jgi:hypothetical protein